MTTDAYERALAFQHRLTELTGSAADISVEDESVVLTFAQVDDLLDRIAQVDRRFRKRDVLVAQIMLLMRTAELRHPVFDNDAAYQENIANRLLDALGVAVLTEPGEQTALIRSGEVETMTRNEFERRSGVRSEGSPQ